MNKPSADRDEAFATLYHVLVELVKIAAPYVPFFSDAIYRNLRHEAMPDSVHLCDFPAYHPECRDEALRRGDGGSSNDGEPRPFPAQRT